MPEVQEQPATIDAAAPFDPEKIMAELDSACGVLPEAAIREARAHRDVMVPRLIQEIREATAKIRSGQKVEGMAHFFALFMLTEFGAKEALPAIIEAVSLPGEGPFDLFEDAITECLAGILVKLSDDPIPLLDGLIQNQQLNEFVRWEGAQGYAHLVRNGRLSREQAVEHLREHLRREMDGQHVYEVITGLISTLDLLAAREGYEQIKEAFAQGLVDEWSINLKDVDRSIAKGEKGVQDRLDDLRVIDDAIEELRTWAAFRPVESKPSLRAAERPARSELPAEPAAQRVEAIAQLTSSKHVGRNDPCPCGSGKKYKKCCLDKDRA